MKSTNKIDYSTQMIVAPTLDALLVLGGEGNNSRTNHTHKIWSRVSEERRSPLRIILTGHHSGMSSMVSERTESEMMRAYLEILGVPKNLMLKEEQSLDTLGNYYFAYGLVDQVCSGSNSKTIGIVTDGFHIDRGMWAARMVLGSGYTIYPIPSPKEGDWKRNAIERLIINAWRFDLRNISAGDREEFADYFATRHPMHVENAPWSAYKTGIACMKRLG